MTANHITTLLAQIKEFGLDADPAFFATDVATLDKTYNGAGPDWFPEHLREVLTELLETYEPAFCIHDWDYEFLPKSFMEFCHANDRLGDNCERIVRAHIPWWRPLKRWEEYGKIALIVDACQEFGYGGFMEAQK